SQYIALRVIGEGSGAIQSINSSDQVAGGVVLPDFSSAVRVHHGGRVSRQIVGVAGCLVGRIGNGLQAPIWEIRACGGISSPVVPAREQMVCTVAVSHRCSDRWQLNGGKISSRVIAVNIRVPVGIGDLGNTSLLVASEWDHHSAGGAADASG